MKTYVYLFCITYILIIKLIVNLKQYNEIDDIEIFCYNEQTTTLTLA